MFNEFAEVEKYIELLINFTGRRITHKEFHMKYLEIFTNEKYFFEDEKKFDILNELFYDVEEYTPLVDLREEGDIDDVGLLESAKVALSKLKEI